MRFSRQELLETLADTRLDLDEFDQEDVSTIIDVLLEAFSPLEIMTWLFFIDRELDEIPAVMVRDGRTRAVMARARSMVLGRSKATTP